MLIFKDKHNHPFILQQDRSVHNDKNALWSYSAAKTGSKILRTSLLPSVDPPACIRLIWSFYKSSSCWPLETGSELAAERHAPKIRGGKIRAVSWQQGWMQSSVSWEPWKCNCSCVIWTIPLWFKEVLCT